LSAATIKGTTAFDGEVVKWNGNTLVELNQASYNSPLNVWTPSGPDRWVMRTGVGDFAVTRIQTQLRTAGKAQIPSVQYVHIAALATGSANYAPLSDLTNGDDVSFHVYRAASDYWLSTTPYTLLKDILDGAFSNDATLQVPYSLGSLETTHPLPRSLFRITEATEAIEFIEKHICLPFGLGYAIEPYLDGSIPRSRMRFFSTRLPTSLSGLPTITGDDVVANGKHDWSSDEPLLYVKGTYYGEQKNSVARDSADGSQPFPAPTVTTEYLTIVGLVTGSDATYRSDTLEFRGIRSVDNDATHQPSAVEGQDSHVYATGLVRRFLTDYYDRYKSGNPKVALTCARTSIINDSQVGDYALVEVEALPNQAIHQRSGTRLMQCVGWNPNGLTIDVEFVDSGANSTMASPTLNSVGSTVANTLTVSLTTAVPAMVEYEIAVVAAGGSVPGAASHAWVLHTTEYINATTLVRDFVDIPEGRTVYVRVRAKSPIGNDLKLPSAWVTSTGVTLNSIDTPTDLVLSAIHLKGAILDWVNTETDLPIEVWLASPAGTVTDQVALVPAGSTRYRLRGLDRSSSQSHRVGIRYVDAYAGFGAFATADFTAAGAPPQLDAPAAIVLYVSERPE
jgi:hypothetical protein